eukprot:GHVQ01030528.1.p2 GENE.GHVQ01030528.1~~GHVQ01030528.1.p2  ORF type:complete len:100 (+),score=9.64 GHVQ01030528.1:85-384(+)
MEFVLFLGNSWLEGGSITGTCVPHIYSDNKGCIFLAKNPIFQKRTKHIDIRHHFIREALESKKFLLEHQGTDEMIADGLTKALPKDKHNFCARGFFGFM